MRNFRLSDEDGHQEAIIEWCGYRKGIYPELDLLYHVPNGGKRDKATATALKRRGVRAGVPDLVLPVARCGYHGLYIELKAPGGKATKEQKDYIAALRQQGYKAEVCVGWEAAVNLMADYLEGKLLEDAGKPAATDADGGVLLPAT